MKLGGKHPIKWQGGISSTILFYSAYFLCTFALSEGRQTL